MILQSLVAYYETMREKNEITAPGWCQAKISFALNITAQGELISVVPLKREEERGKKVVLRPQQLEVPQMVSRSSGIAANFLCDNSSYITGFDNKGKPKRSLECFEAAKELHLHILDGAGGEAAQAVKNYFLTWDPGHTAENELLKPHLEEILAGANLIFSTKAGYVHLDNEVRAAWEKHCQSQQGGAQGICLVTGEHDRIARTHGTIQGVQGAQSSGAALVSFNAPSFESYGQEQSFNAPVGEYAVYAYTTALTKLLGDREHTTTIGDTTIVYWSESGQEIYQDLFAVAMEPTIDNQEIVDGMFKALGRGDAVAVEDIEEEISYDQKFYILGLAPNAARIAVRFFYQDSFGGILSNLKAHYERMEIIRPANQKCKNLGIWQMLQETVNKKSRDKKPVANMAGAVYRAVISGDRYPTALYHSVLGRIRAEQDDKDARIYKITRGRAAIIKAFLIRNGLIDRKELTMALNEHSENTAYVLGREFAVLEAIQEDANPGINATIKDRYFNSASATPAIIFPILFRLKNSHIRKLGIGLKINYEKLLGSLQEKIEIIPKRLSLEEQGMFILGYYHQTQKRYEKKTKEEHTDGGSN